MYWCQTSSRHLSQCLSYGNHRSFFVSLSWALCCVKPSIWSDTCVHLRLLRKDVREVTEGMGLNLWPRLSLLVIWWQNHDYTDIAEPRSTTESAQVHRQTFRHYSCHNLSCIMSDLCPLTSSSVHCWDSVLSISSFFLITPITKLHVACGPVQDVCLDRYVSPVHTSNPISRGPWRFLHLCVRVNMYPAWTVCNRRMRSEEATQETATFSVPWQNDSPLRSTSPPTILSFTQTQLHCTIHKSSSRWFRNCIPRVFSRTTSVVWAVIMLEDSSSSGTSFSVVAFVGLVRCPMTCPDISSSSRCLYPT